MAKDRTIYLIGPMGSGKTVVGKSLARRLKRSFFDTDQWIERKTGQSIEDVFAKKGEPRFRSLERAAVKVAAKRPGAVVALGGGAPCQPEVRRVLATGITVRLTAKQRELWRRVSNQRHRRPLLKEGTPAQGQARLAELIRKREPSYPKGDVRVSTSGASPEAAAGRIAAALKRRGLS